MIDLSKLSARQLSELKAQVEAEQANAAARKKADIEAYRKMVSETVESSFPKLEEQSETLSKAKADVFKAFETALAMKSELFRTKEGGQWSHTFMNEGGDLRITLGTNTIDSYDDTAEAGIAMVNEYLDSLAEYNESAARAVGICRSLMAKDRKGNLKPSRIITLRKHALESGDAKFLEGVEVIMNAYRPTPSKQYVRAERKDGMGQWRSIPLGMTEAE